MNDLRVFNEKLFNEYLYLNRISELSSPLFVSSKRFLNTIAKNPIMYIGQETNGWCNYNKDHAIISVDEIENKYDEFLIDRTTSKSIYWRFIKEIISGDYNDIYKNVVWTNTLLVGKRYSKGAPEVNDKLFKLSLDNLLFLYEYFEPSLIINVSGSSNPYYSITKSFLEKINSNIKDSYPCVDNQLIIDDELKIAWTNHPYNLLFNKKFDDYAKKIKAIKKYD